MEFLNFPVVTGLNIYTYIAITCMAASVCIIYLVPTIGKVLNITCILQFLLTWCSDQNK